MVEPDFQRVRWRDIGEMMAGGSMMAFPIAVTEEVWKISETLPIGRVVYLSLSSLLVIGLFIYFQYFSGHVRGNVGHFVIRVLAVYFVTMWVSATVLFALNHLMTAETATIALKRVIIVSYPASFAATIVDGLSRD